MFIWIIYNLFTFQVCNFNYERKMKKLIGLIALCVIGKVIKNSQSNNKKVLSTQYLKDEAMFKL